MISKHTNIVFVVFFTLIFNVISAQTKSIAHIVRKGDNIYRLSIQYQVSMESIFNLNPGSETVIKVGETLLIPIPSESTSNDYDSEVKTHVVKKGETKYGLSKKYNVSIKELEDANPSIVNMLIAGQTIEVTSSNSNNKSLGAASTNNLTHTVRAGETLWGISQKYNISLDTLKELNEDNISEYPNIYIGQVLELKENAEKSDEEAELVADTYIVNKGDTKYGLSKRFNITISELEKLNPEIIPTLKTGTLIRTKSFELNKDATRETKITSTNNEETKTADKKDLIRENNNISNSNVSVFWEKNLESDSESNDERAKYYKGLILAMDSINIIYPKINLNFTNIEPFTNDTLNNASSSTTYVNPLDYEITSLNLSEGMDVFSIMFKEQDSVKKIFVKALPTEDAMRDRVLDYIKKENGHVISLYDDDHLTNKGVIETVLPHTSFIKISKKGIFQSEDLTNALSLEKKNFVIIESSDVGVFLNSTNLLLKKMSSADIQLVVLNPRNIPSKEKITTKRLKILRLLFPKQHNLVLNNDMDKTVALSFAINFDAFQRLIANDDIKAFTNTTKPHVLGLHFNYLLKNNVLMNNAVPLFIFNENSNHFLISKD